ncbi:probable G-protein coupled receptor 158 [Hemicordylus capensis]|uniref:probable G-protein coupled receptor 158 n=1 Tax=Hemicordylus capensis TaxID=884348 RepID=UPI002302A454|nr:probable G-protein coupled receptor 158 [Hemicordylus capensis]
MGLPRLLLLLLFCAHLWFVVDANQGRTVAGKEKAVKGKQAIYNHVKSAALPFSPWNRSTEESTILAHRLVQEVPPNVASFLFTGDSQELRHANCSGRYELANLPAKSRLASHPLLHGALDALIHATNVLNMILQSNKSREQNLQEDLEWYQALIRSLLEGDPNISRAAITFNLEPMSSAPQVFLQASRQDSQILLQDLSSVAHHLANASSETEWFHSLKRKWRPHLHRKGLNLGSKALENSWKRKDGYPAEKSHIKWSSPYLECENGNYKPAWLVTLSAAFYASQPNLLPEFRGVVKVDINLQKVDIDQCSNEGWFSGTHRCHLNSSECMPIKGHGFVLGAYKCNCKAGFYHPKIFSENSYHRKDAESHFSGGEMPEEVYACLPCREGCSYCTNDTPCYAQEDQYLRLAIISFQTLCMLLDFISMLLVYRFRKAKSIRASGLILLETILFGSLLLYFPVIILYFEPSTFRCILLRWVRLLGFTTVYGTVTLKLHRVLKVFLSRTVQRIPYMTGGRVMRMLAVILLVVVWFLTGWTSAVCQNLEKSISLIGQGQTSDHLIFNMCLIDRWDYMMAIAEFLFLLWGVYLCYAVRTVPSAFHEPRYMAVAVHIELIISAVFHIIRFSLASRLHSDWMLMLFFAHTHLTVTVTIGLLLIPKFSHSSNNPRDDIPTEAYEDELDMGRSGSYLNSSINSAWSEHSLDPDDIRDELKKLYAQLEIYKRKKMITNNPHLQKKRCSKKGLGRSIMRRITEIPETVTRQCSREEKDFLEHGVSKNTTMARKNPPDSSGHIKPKEESLRNRVLSLKKSHSTYDHVRDQMEESNSLATESVEVITATENSLLDSLPGKKPTKKAPEKVETVSTENVPLVCKSVSAHNLSEDKKPLHPRTSVLQKSLSVIASAKEKTLGLAGKMQNEESGKSHKSQQKGKEGSKKHSGSDKSEHKDSHRKNSAHAEEPRKPHKSGIMKQQRASQAPANPDVTASKPLPKNNVDIGEVCPWEIYDQSPGTGLADSRAQKHVSIASSESEKSQPSQAKSKTQQKTAESNQKSTDRCEVCPWEGQEEHLMEDQKKQLSSKAQESPGMQGENANKQYVASVCAGESKELPPKTAQTTDKDCTNKLGEQIKNVSSPAGNALPSDPNRSTTSNLQQPLTSRVNICPWEFEAPELLKSEPSIALSNTTSLSSNKTAAHPK